MKNEISETVKYINDNIATNDKAVCRWLTEYLHTSYRYSKYNWVGPVTNSQPGWPDEVVSGYTAYTDVWEGYRKAKRLILYTESNHQIDISLHKFKEFARKRNLSVSNKNEDYEEEKA